MTDKQLRNAKFEAMIRLAVIENFEEEMASIPPREELEKLYTFSERHTQRMQRMFARARRMDIYKVVRKISSRVAVILLVMASLAFGALMLNNDVRAAVSRTLIEWFSTFTRFSFTSDSIADKDMEWRPSYLPEGFIETYVFASVSLTKVEYTNTDGVIITLKYMPTDSSTVGIDNEHSNYSIEKIDGIEYHIFSPVTEDYPVNLVWEYEYFVFGLEAFFDQEELIKIATSIK